MELRGLEPLTPCMPCRCATSCATAPNTGPGKNYSLRKQSDQLNAQTGGMRIRTETLRARTGDRDHRSAYNGPGNKKSAGTLRFRRISGGAEGTRTPDPLHAMQVRYQLRHSPEIFVAPAQIRPVNPARSADFLSGSLRSNSNILDQPFGKFQIGHIRLGRADHSVSEVTVALADVSFPSCRSTTGQSFQRRSKA